MIEWWRKAMYWGVAIWFIVLLAPIVAGNHNPVGGLPTEGFVISEETTIYVAHNASGPSGIPAGIEKSLGSFMVEPEESFSIHDRTHYVEWETTYQWIDSAAGRVEAWLRLDNQFPIPCSFIYSTFDGSFVAGFPLGGTGNQAQWGSVTVTVHCEFDGLSVGSHTLTYSSVTVAGTPTEQMAHSTSVRVTEVRYNEVPMSIDVNTAADAFIPSLVMFAFMAYFQVMGERKKDNIYRTFAGIISLLFLLTDIDPLLKTIAILNAGYLFYMWLLQPTARAGSGEEK